MTARRPPFVFPDGDDWIVFLPDDHLLLRTNAAAAARFAALDAADVRRRPTPSSPRRLEFAPTRVTVSPVHGCAQRCVYCYGTPAHRNGARLDPNFARAGIGLAAGHAAAQGRRLDVHFHGVGEPTLAWDAFVACVDAAEDAASEHGVEARLDLCTGGQVDADRARFISERFDTVAVSIDGPAEIQNAQRPRADGADSLARPLALAREHAGRRKTVTVKATVTRDSVDRMIDLVDFVASEIGLVHLDLGMMFAPPWVDPGRSAAPSWRDFVSGFAAALDRGAEVGVCVEHPSIRRDMLLADDRLHDVHLCLAPPDLVTAYYDVPREGRDGPCGGVFGRWDRASGRLILDRERLQELVHDPGDPRCEACPCRSACFGPGGVKGRMPENRQLTESVCHARVGVLREILRRSAPARTGPTLEATT